MHIAVSHAYHFRVLQVYIWWLRFFKSRFHSKLSVILITDHIDVGRKHVHCIISICMSLYLFVADDSCCAAAVLDLTRNQKQFIWSYVKFRMLLRSEKNMFQCYTYRVVWILIDILVIRRNQTRKTLVVSLSSNVIDCLILCLNGKFVWYLERSYHRTFKRIYWRLVRKQCWSVINENQIQPTRQHSQCFLSRHFAWAI